MKLDPTDTLVLLVTCSLDPSRRDMAVEVVKNLADKLPEAGLSSHFMVFDNASAYKDHLAYVPQGAYIVESPDNVGYWSAIKWVLDIGIAQMGGQYKYMYIVESDLYHTDLKALSDCTKFLEVYPDAACVRTQEFSVRARWRFDKALKFLPFHVTRSEIRLQNLVTGERAWFRPTNIPKLFCSNLHAKLPALNRIEALHTVFKSLGQYEQFSEGDFFAEMFKRYSTIGVYDGGLFYSLYSRDDQTVMSGSYTNAAQLSQTGYQQTRKSRIVPIQYDLEIARAS